ncbi:MAG: hypothetical protein FJ319_14675 [SAR202 cluster bacterium]|nr:hypothetical protein [SAR202 cluster bacterium]
MDGDFVIDLKEVMENIETAEVMSLSFPTFNKSAVIDTRSNETEGPLICIMPIVSSPRERIRSIRRVRPGFPRVRNLTVIPWPRYVDSLVTLGIWGRIIDRFNKAGQKQAAAACEEILAELHKLEKAELAAAVAGTNYHTIWSSEE